MSVLFITGHTYVADWRDGAVGVVWLINLPPALFLGLGASSLPRHPEKQAAKKSLQTKGVKPKLKPNLNNVSWISTLYSNVIINMSKIVINNCISKCSAGDLR